MRSKRELQVTSRRRTNLGSGGHHHSSSDGVKRVRGKTGTGGDGPSESEGGGEVALERTDEDNGLDRVVHSWRKGKQKGHAGRELSVSKGSWREQAKRSQEITRQRSRKGKRKRDEPK
jgi:hypothetical protein